MHLFSGLQILCSSSEICHVMTASVCSECTKLRIFQNAAIYQKLNYSMQLPPQKKVKGEDQMITS